MMYSQFGDHLNLKAISLGRGSSSVVTNAIKNVVRSDWEFCAKKSNASIVLLNRISEFMRSEMNSMDYEALCMKNIAAHSQRMSKEDLRPYLCMLQALVKGYKQRYGQEVANLLMVGLTQAARDPQSAKKHFDSLLSDIGNKAEFYNAAAVMESTKVQNLSRELQIREASVISRIFKKREIRSIRAKIEGRKNKIAKMERRKENYVNLASALKGVADPSAPKA